MHTHQNTMAHTRAKILVSAIKRRVSRGDTNGIVVGH